MTASSFDRSATWARCTPYLFIAPAVLVMAAGLLYPVADAIYLSFSRLADRRPTYDKAENVGWANYIRMVADPGRL